MGSPDPARLHAARERASTFVLITKLTTSGISSIVAQAGRRAGTTPFGAHRVRHQAASAMRQAGSPLWEIGQVLRHRRMVTTAHYAKPTVAETRVVARPWIGGDVQ